MQLIPVVMCGGAGVRLWPLSRKNHPKQFVPLFDGGETLFRRTMDRVARFKASHSVVVCNAGHRFFVADSLSARERESCAIIVEPRQCNTAPAATLAALAAKEQGDDALLLIMPSDHVIAAPDLFVQAVGDASAAAVAGNIVIFGVHPTRPETEYGYIRSAVDESHDENHDAHHDARAPRKVIEFSEKPDAQTAADWIARGDCHWNSGIFLVAASVYLDVIGKFEAATKTACESAWENRYEDLGFVRVPDEKFESCRNISIDHAVIERADNVMMVAADMGWSDLGSWPAIGAVMDDSGDNLVRGDVVLKNSRGNIIYADERLVGVLGIDDCIIADTRDALLVAAKQHAPQVRELVGELKAANRREADEQRKVFRPWGSYESIYIADNFQVKRIIINPGHGLSLQTHRHRSEHWVVVKGCARVTKGDEIFTLTANQSTYIPAQTKHRLENVDTQPIQLIEVQCGSYLGEDDIVRFDDRYGRD